MLVSGQELRVQGFGEGDVGGVVGIEIVPKRPRAVDQLQRRITGDRKLEEVIRRLTRPSGVEPTPALRDADRLQGLGIQQVGSSGGLGREDVRLG